MPKKKDEHGAVAIMTAVLMVVVMGISAFAIDIGMQRVSRRDMQAMADVVALDMARRLDGRTVSQLSADPAWGTALDESVARNNETVGDPPAVSYELGTVDDLTGDFVALPGDAVPDAVKITAASAVDYVIHGGRGAVSRDAVGTQDAQSCFKLGSWAANLDSRKSLLLNAILGDALRGSALNVTLVGYEGLADAEVSILELAAELGAGTVDELLDTEVSVGELLQATANVLSANSDSVNASLLNTIRAAITSTLLVDVRIGDLLTATKGGDSALASTFNVLDLLVGSVMVANGEHFVEVPSVAINAGFLGNVALELSVIEAAKLACGPVHEATASTSQIDLGVSANLINLPSILGLTASGALDLDLEFAKAEGTLTEINCPTPGSPDEGITVNVGSYLTGIRLSVPITLRGTGLLSSLRVLVSVSLNTSKPVTERDVVITVMPPYDYGDPVSTSSGSLGLTGMTPTVTAQVQAGLLGLGLSLGSIIGSVTNLIVNPLLNTIESSVLPMLQGLLGLSVAGADVIPVSSPDCESPKLAG